MPDTDTDTTTTDEPKAPTPEELKALREDAAKWKELARKHEDRAKASHAELEKLKADKDSSTTDTEKLAARVEAAEKRAADAELAGLRYQVAAAKKLTPGQAKRLVGTTLEDLEADADELLETFKIQPATGDGKDGAEGAGKEKSDAATSGGRPKEALRAGADKAAEPEEDDPRALAAKIPRDRF